MSNKETTLLEMYQECENKGFGLWAWTTLSMALVVLGLPTIVLWFIVF